MRAIIAGGTGFIGRALVQELKDAGWEIMVLTRSAGKVADVFGGGVIGLRWDNEDWPQQLGPDVAVINLAGANIAAGRWTRARKKAILDSRLGAGRRIVEAVQGSGKAPGVLIQASGVGYYGPRDNEAVDESAPLGDGFLADVTRQWEASTEELEAMGVRRCVIRTGLVLGDGGALARMLPPFRAYMGGPPGSGEQGASWIHMVDEVGAIRFLLEQESTQGVYNLTAPNPVDFNAFSKALGEALGRPYGLNVPPLALKALFGEMADELLLNGQRALPKRLLEAGYAFRFPHIAEAMVDLVG